MARQQLLIYQIQDLESARDFLSHNKQSIIITNMPGSTRYYGIMVLDYIFRTLSKEFSQIIDIILEVENDHAALFSAIKLGYSNINYTGSSDAAKKMLARCLEDRNKVATRVLNK